MPRFALALAIALVCLTAPFAAQGQTDQGRWSLSVFTDILFEEFSGSGSVAGQRFGFADESTSVSVDLEIGYFVADDQQIGGALFVESSDSKELDPDTGAVESESEELFTFWYVFYKWFFDIGDGDLKWFIGPEFGQVATHVLETDADTRLEIDDAGFGIGGFVGLSFFLSEDLSINGEYNVYSIDTDADATFTDFTTGETVNITLESETEISFLQFGLTYFF